MPILPRPQHAVSALSLLTRSHTTLQSRWFSSTHAQRSGQFTVVVPPVASQQSVLDTIRRSRDSLLPAGTGISTDNAAVVLASPALAAWLEDEAFLSQLLGLLPVTAAEQTQFVSVLGAVVDGLAAPRLPLGSSTPPNVIPGLAILHGDVDALLPGLWAERSLVSSQRTLLDVEAAITVRMAPLPATTSALEVTVPLAHTVFQNGRRSTLLASRWTVAVAAGDTEGPLPRRLRREHTEAREHQRIVPPRLAAASSSSVLSIPLLALAEPRTIAASLGNIVRQVYEEASGVRTPVPASRELEAVIPALLMARRAAAQPESDDSSSGPLGVWALVVPPAAEAQYAQLRAKSASEDNTTAVSPLRPLPAAAGHAAATEQHAAARTSAQFTALLAKGCRLHKILSGGGGWGRKQGLLSLDPQMSHPVATTGPNGQQDTSDDDDDEAMLSFIRSFQGGGSTTEGPVQSQGGVDGIAEPGAIVQFFVSPQQRVSAAETARPWTTAPETEVQPPRSLVLGAHGGSEDCGSAVNDGDIVLLRNHFGAVAEQGIFVAAAANGAGETTTTTTTKTTRTKTKLDVPGTYMWEEASAN